MTTVLFRARVPKARLEKAEKVLQRLGLKPGDAFNMLLAQIEIRGDIPFDASMRPKPLLSAAQQADEWENTFGRY